MVLVISSQLNLKNNLVHLSDKLDENNFSTWQKSVMLTLRTLKLIDHLSYDKVSPQYEFVPVTEDDSDSASKITGEGATPGVAGGSALYWLWEAMVTPKLSLFL
ncbi:hypothetical protein PIB30_004513 [Stylosanthes scabra]|uniref:Retrotransposon Copia-like N-terminal domain-containing protein n=1 Tax=Stylosanthes scabra TaxID=79078 RepID=A0ABU6X5G1_9FABA|nr:hypothetical protein [Stylosanthes scabra]